MAASQSGTFSLQEFSDIGAPLVGGRLYTYVYGTTTHKTAYTDKAGTIPHTYTSDGIGGQYIALNARGELPAPLYLAAGSYDIALKDASGATIWTRRADPVDDTASAYDAAIRADLASTSGAALIGSLQSGAGAVSRTLDSRAKDTVYLLDFVPTNLHASIADGTITTNLVPYLRAAVDSRVGGITVILPIGTTYATTLFYAGKNGVHIKGQGFAASKYKFVNAAGGTVFAGDADTTSSLAQYESCSFTDFEVVTSGNAATDPSIVVDLTSFSYSTFDLEIECRRVGATLYYGQGNAGTAPYYNRITSTGLFGGTDRTQTAFKFRSGLFSGGSNGPNANIVGPITRAANLAVLTDIRSGQGNLFNNISAESIDGGYFVLGGESAIDTGTSTGTNTDITLNDTGKAWTSAAFVNGAVQITGGTGSGQVRTIRTNTSTRLTLNEPWSTVPNATSQYSIFALTCSKNKFVNLRGEGLSSLNPDWIYSSPGADGNEFLFQSVESLGSGQYVVDYSGSVKNNWFGANKQILTFTFASPGASANLNAQPRNGVFGGLTLAGDFVVEWMKAAVDGTSHGGTATLTLDVGGSATGGGTQTLGCEIVNGNSQAMALPVGNARVIHLATNAAIHINLATDASFSAGRSVTVSVCVSMVF